MLFRTNRAILLYIFLAGVGLNLSLLHACPITLERDEVANPFYRLTPSSPTSTRAIGAALRSKYVMRSLLRGGPIAQPSFFKVFAPDGIADYQLATAAQKTKHIFITSPSLVNPLDVIHLRNLPEQLLAGKIQLPLVFKPNFSAFSIGVIFFEGDLSDLKIKLLGSAEVVDIHRCIENVRALFNAKNIQVEQDAGGTWVRSKASPSKNAELVREIIQAVSFTYTQDKIYYDPGMIETKLPFLKPSDKTYESRHEFFVNLATGKYRLSLDPEPELHTRGSFARWGNAPAKTLAPLVESGLVPSTRLIEFDKYLDDLIGKEITYLRNRLQGAGIAFNGELRGQIDLMWLPADSGSNGFPKPVVVESLLTDFNVKTHPFENYLRSLGFKP